MSSGTGPPARPPDHALNGNLAAALCFIAERREIRSELEEGSHLQAPRKVGFGSPVSTPTHELLGDRESLFGRHTQPNRQLEAEHQLLYQRYRNSPLDTLAPWGDDFWSQSQQ